MPPHWLDTWESRDLLARYMNDIEAMDREYGGLVRVLNDRGLYQDAMVIFTSDHGFEHFSKCQYPWLDLEQWMRQQGDMGLESELAVPLWERRN